MVSAKDLRDVFEELRQEAGKRASEMVKDADLKNIDVKSIVRRDEPPALLWFGLGLGLGAILGVAIALLVAPYSGDEARRRLGSQVDRVRRQGEEELEQMRAGDGGTAYTTPSAAAYERSSS